RDDPNARAFHPPGVSGTIRAAGARAKPALRLAVQLFDREPLELPDAFPGDARAPPIASDTAIARVLHAATDAVATEVRPVFATLPGGVRGGPRAARPAAGPGRRPRRTRPCPVLARSARLPNRELLRVLFRPESSGHLLPDRSAARRAGALLPAQHQRRDAG